MPLYQRILRNFKMIFILQYSFDRRHYKNASRRAGKWIKIFVIYQTFSFIFLIEIPIANTIENTNTTVVYTIPTTGQLTTTYPELQRPFPNTHSRPPPYVTAGEKLKKITRNKNKFQGIKCCRHAFQFCEIIPMFLSVSINHP